MSDDDSDIVDRPIKVNGKEKNKISKALSKRKDALQAGFESYLMTCNRTNGILVLHTGAYKPQILTGGPAIAKLGPDGMAALEAFLRAVIEEDARCLQLLEDFNSMSDIKPLHPTEGFFEVALEKQLIVPIQVAPLKAALGAYDGCKKQPRWKTTTAGKDRLHTCQGLAAVSC